VRGLQRDDGNLELLDKMQIRMELPDWRILPLARSCLRRGWKRRGRDCFGKAIRVADEREIQKRRRAGDL